MIHPALAGPESAHSFKGALIVLGAGLNAARAQDAVSLLGVVVLGLAFVWVELDRRLRQARRDRRLADAEADEALRRVAAAAGRDDLASRLASLQGRLDEQATELVANQEHMRVTLHKIKDDLHTARLENGELRDALATSDRACTALGAALAEAHRRAAESFAAAVTGGPAPGPPR